MATLGDFLAGTAEGLTKAIGTAGQAVGTAQNIQSMLGEAERMRMEREIFPYKLQTAKTQSEREAIETGKMKRQEEYLTQPMPLPGEETQAVPTQATQPPPQTVAEQATKQAIEQSTLQQLKQPIDARQIIASGVVPKQTIQTILQDPFLRNVAVSYDDSGRPYTTIERLQALNNVLSTTSAIESGLTQKVAQSTIQGLNAEKDKIYEELEKLYEDPEKNKDKIQKLQNKLIVTNKRIESAIQYGVATDMKLLADYYYKEGRLTNEQEKMKNDLEVKLSQMGLQMQIQQLKNEIDIQKAVAEQGKIKSSKTVKFLLRDGSTINGTIQTTPTGETRTTDLSNRPINPNDILEVYPAGDTLDELIGRATLQKGTEKGKGKTKQPKLKPTSENEYMLEW